ncbi:hypothetical protein MMC28_001295 [Mycoblastus sanguinarius]|nr:hypothetical protein [Mycoblastus sanguinarius]
MPRDLFSSDLKEESLVASPESQTPRPEGAEGLTAIGDDGYNEFTIHGDESRQTSFQQLRTHRANANGMNDLHPYVQTLSLSNLESCVALENAVFPEHERCSREKFMYRLTRCPELCFGLFSTTPSSTSTATMPTYASALPAFSASPELKSVLIAMIIATKTSSGSITDESMEYPPDWQSTHSTPQEARGHQEAGRTICIQTLGVLPAYQGRGLGKTIMKSYQQRMETSGIADRIALLAHDHLVKMYSEGMGFEDRGKSDVKFGGGGWNSLIYEFTEHGPGS